MCAYGLLFVDIVLCDRVVVVVEWEAGDDLVQPVRLDTEDGPIVFKEGRLSGTQHVPSSCKVATRLSLTPNQEKVLGVKAKEVCMRAFGRERTSCDLEVLRVIPPVIGGHILSSSIGKYASDVKADTSIEVSDNKAGISLLSRGI